MLSGFNTNVRHKGVLFHVQTEDSGRGKPHVITHLFHGGNILASEKRSYEHLLEAEDLEPQVKRLMDEQHRTMLEKLRSGGHDAVIRERLGSGAKKAAADEATIPPKPVPATPAAAAAKPAPTPVRAAERAPDPPPPGDRQRPLDEVVLDYLLDSARQRSKR
jgi:hypothetical protein